jgi:beta-mannosidase
LSAAPGRAAGAPSALTPIRREIPDGQTPELKAAWELAAAAPNEFTDPSRLEQLEWMPARVPGTASAALRAAGMWRAGDPRDFDSEDWWFRTRFENEPTAEGEELTLALDGIATVAEVYLDGERILESDSMFAAHRLDVSGVARGEHELSICCRALSPLLKIRRKPRARWRTKLVSEGNLRFYRTMLLGRAPGLAPGPAAVGPWKPIRLERRRLVAVDDLQLRAGLDGSEGRLRVRARIRALAPGSAVTAARVEVAGRSAELRLQDGEAHGELVVPDIEQWWPHTHGKPTRYSVKLHVRADGEELEVDGGRVGFRALESAGQLQRDGIQLRINGVPVFARGAVWTPPDIALPATSEDEARRILETVREAGMNMVRVPGIGCYESEAFHELCDELGILLWQDFMFANLDYPEQDEGFMQTVEREGRHLLRSIGGRPSLTVLCGGSEVAQQVAMLGLDPSLASGPLYGELLPRLVGESVVDAPYVESTPWGGDLPFRPNRGVANYYGVGAYLRPLEDARRSEVRFAAECLAFSNVPDEEALEQIDAPGGLVVHHPKWKAGVPRDPGAGWDFEDVRDHYLRELFGLDPVGLRWSDHEHYLELSRAVTGELMAEVFGEWRREGSPCGGGMVLWLTDLMPGAGWGLLDHRGQPKVALHQLRRALAPVAVWSTDEGLGGIVAHVANDRPVPLQATLRVALYRDLELQVDQAQREVIMPPHAVSGHNVEDILGRFVDVTWAYRFGAPAQDLIVLTLERHEDGGSEVLSQSFRLPVGRPSGRQSAATLGLRATAVTETGDETRVIVSTRRFAYGVRLHVPGYQALDDAFSVEPGHAREIPLRRLAGSEAPVSGHAVALNLSGRVAIEAEVDGG